MTVDYIVGLLKVNGWCVIEDVIPAEEVASIRDAVCRQVAEQREERERLLTGARADGHRVGSAGLGCAQDIVSTVPAIAARLADRRLVGAAETFFGPHVRISSTSAIVTNPNNEPGSWHADWPFNQRIAAHLPAPYPDVVIHLSSLFMLSEFSAETGATLIVPGSHRCPDNPSGDNGVDPDAPYPKAIHVTGRPGGVFLYDSRLWHRAPINRSDRPRVAVSCRYAPWWLNLQVRRSGSPDHMSIVVETRGRDNAVPLLSPQTYASLPPEAKPLFRHWVNQ
jgi:ectoine hydroxylase-related dioxygenase (phytanoyl-CoA dioxygenase family)